MSANPPSSSTSEISPANPPSSSTSEISPANPPSSSTSEISPANPQRTGNDHSSGSTSGITTDAAAQDMEGQTAAAPPLTHESSDNSLEQAIQLLATIEKDIGLMKKVSNGLNDYENRVSNQITEASKMHQSLINAVKDGPAKGTIEKAVRLDLIDLKKSVMKLTQQLPPMQNDVHGKHHIGGSTHRRQRTERENEDKMPNLCKENTLSNSSAFKDFKALYDGLGDKQKLCLLCFSAFPEKEIIKKRFMFYWWTAEGFLAPVNDSGGKLANEVFRDLMAKGFIEPFSEKRTLDCLVNEYQMHPFVRAAVIELARRAKFFDFDVEGKPTENFSSSCRACLLGREKLKLSEDLESLKNLHMLFNIDLDILDFEKPDLFSVMKNINLLCLGRWQTSQRHHIEVEDAKFLEGLKNMKHLKFLSLQGISQIMNLPKSISGLTNLTILDIKACPNLEKIPGEIGLLKSLMHLDMSECYLLVNMPKEISTLTELEVLKGFVVGDARTDCTLGDLSGLPKLSKLGIFTGKNSFPSDSELKELNQLEKLRNLTIEWGRDPSKNRNKAENDGGEKPAAESDKQENRGDADANVLAHEGNNGESNNTGNEVDSRATQSTTKLNCFRTTTPVNTNADALPFLPTNLEKLDLECCPQTYAPGWLTADKLKNIKKLYIRGGNLRDLGQFPFQENCEWEVEILRLKFLNDLEMDWRGLMELFPKLDYLEKVRCPKLTFFPCDEQGVWMK